MISGSNPFDANGDIRSPSSELLDAAAPMPIGSAPLSAIPTPIGSARAAAIALGQSSELLDASTEVAAPMPIGSAPLSAIPTPIGSARAAATPIAPAPLTARGDAVALFYDIRMAE